MITELCKSITGYEQGRKSTERVIISVDKYPTLIDRISSIPGALRQFERIELQRILDRYEGPGVV